VGEIGLDFDGTIRKLPFPWDYLMKYTSPNDVLERAKLKKIKHILFYIANNYLPIILNGELIKKFQGKEIIIISGRREKIEEVDNLLRRYFRNPKIYIRGNRKIYEEKWKLKICRKEGITTFYEDRRFVIDYLKKHGVEVP